MLVRARLCLAVVLAVALVTPAFALPTFIEFESGQVRPLAMSPDGTRLFAVNTPDNTLEIFAIGTGGIVRTASVTVGLEPVAVAARSNSEVWVVNHLSDSVSVVDVSATPPRVTRTLLVGDEPRDIVFADPPGATGLRAFISTAHRGQQRTDSLVAGVPGGGDPKLTTPGVGRADVWVFDAANPGAGVGGVPLKIASFFADTPRALAVNATGSRVYVAAFHSGNQTTTVSEGVVCDDATKTDLIVAGACTLNGSSYPGGLPLPTQHDPSLALTAGAGNRGAPEVGLIVKFDGTNWVDELSRNWNNAVKFTLPDEDVFALDTDTLAPTDDQNLGKGGIQGWAKVGTILFNMVVGPTGKIYVSNTESPNHVRFEGPGIYADTVNAPGVKPTVQGHLSESRITIINGGTVTPRHLNKHLDYSVRPAPAGKKNHSLATPNAMALNGSTLYVAAFGSSKVGVFDTTALENNTFNPELISSNYITVTGGGPSGLVVDSARNRLYVMTRFDNSVSVVNLGTNTESQHVAMANPEPATVVQGRPFLYDAFNTSSNGEASCSSCHIFGDNDDLAWDLGNPDDVIADNPIPINLVGAAGNQNGGASNTQFHPMKGPMTTQTLRGMSNSGAMHWRGDRANGFFGLDSPYANGNEDLSFRNFIVAFPGLVGNNTTIAPGDMQKFADFTLQVQLPPNPIRNLDNSLKNPNAPAASEQRGANFYSGTRRSDGANQDNFGFTCNGCHTLDASQGFFGTGALSSFENETQILKIAHLRNVYTKIGMFGMPQIGFLNAGNNGSQGDQIRGFGVLHDGSVDTVFRFLQATVFNNANPLGLGAVGFPDNQTRLDTEAFVLAFDTDLAPIVGQQVTLTSTNSGAVGGRITTLQSSAGTPFVSKILGPGANQADLVAKAKIGGVQKGWAYNPGPANYTPDDGGAAITPAALQTLAATPGQEVTYTATTPGSGTRVGIDRDLDGDLNGLDNCKDVANATQANNDGDAAGDVCDNCVAKANGNQSDLDTDAIGDVCDNLCVGTVTSITSNSVSAPRDAFVKIGGTGFGPSVQVTIGGLPAATTTDGTFLYAKPDAALAVNLSYPVVVVNPEGCQSQEAAVVTLTTPLGCGLTGVEPFLLLGALAVARRVRRSRSAPSDRVAQQPAAGRLSPS